MNYKELDFTFTGVCRAHHRLAQTVFVSQNIHHGQPKLLRYLHGHDGSSQKELAENCGIEPATVTRLLDTMEKGGLIVRRQNADDKRVYNVFLCEQGRGLIVKVKQIAESLGQQCFKDFTEDEAQQFLGFLHRIKANIKEAQEEEENDPSI